MPRGTRKHTVDLPNGGEAQFRILDSDHSADGPDTARLELTGPDGKRWRIAVEDRGTEQDVERISSYNADGELADVELPNWVTEVLMRLR
jgi:hypothetical protein